MLTSDLNLEDGNLVKEKSYNWYGVSDEANLGDEFGIAMKHVNTSKLCYPRLT